MRYCFCTFLTSRILYAHDSSIIPTLKASMGHLTQVSLIDLQFFTLYEEPHCHVFYKCLLGTECLEDYSNNSGYSSPGPFRKSSLLLFVLILE